MSNFFDAARSVAGKFLKDEAGATAIEYGLLAALLGTALVVSMQGLGNQLKSTFNNTSSAMSVGNAAAA
ncbi:MAG: Flp family type IVb pilin [Proteobacteria bacterium]|nr:Flp family type IVb pilin [Pseudomonadota bacterium]